MTENMKHVSDDTYPLIVRDDPKRRCIFPVKHPHLYHKMYKELALPSFWVVEELSLASDMDDWNNKLTDNERHFLKHVLCFFASADTIVADNLSINFIEECEVMEISMFYQWQAFNEQIHNETYATLIDTYIQDTNERDEAFRAVEHFPAVAAKTDWALQYSDREKASFAERLIAFTCLEGIMFAGSFAAIFYFRSRNLLHGLSAANTYINADENLHLLFAIEVYKLVKHRLPESKVHEIYKSAVDTEMDFIENAIPVNLIGLSVDMMKEYIRYIADYWLTELGYSKLYNAKQPLDYMDKISLESKTNFFERRGHEYVAFQDNKEDDDEDF